jgi:hypothetical protein
MCIKWDVHDLPKSVADAAIAHPLGYWQRHQLDQMRSLDLKKRAPNNCKKPEISPNRGDGQCMNQRLHLPSYAFFDRIPQKFEPQAKPSQALAPPTSFSFFILPPRAL